MMEFTIYGVDQSMISLDSCAFKLPVDINADPNIHSLDLSLQLESTDSNVRNEYVLVGTADTQSAQQQGENVLCLNRCHKEGIADGDIIAPSWILDILHVSNRSKVIVTPVKIKFIDPINISKITLFFKCHKSTRHWDEVSTECSFRIPGSWSTNWPSGLPKNALQKFLPILLQNRTLVDNTILVVDVLDITMVRN